MATKKKTQPIDITKTGALTGSQLQQINNTPFTNQEAQTYNDLNKLFHSSINWESTRDPSKNKEGYVYNPALESDRGKGGWGTSMFDEPVIGDDEVDSWEDKRAEAEPWYAKAASGILKAGVLTGTTFVGGTVGLLYGIEEAIRDTITNDAKGDTWDRFLTHTSKIWDNEVMNWMDDINKKSEEYLPNYYTRDELDSPWYTNILSSNFLFDKVIKNVGFTIGAAYSGGVYSKLLGAAAKGLGAARTLASGAKVTEEAIDAGRKAMQASNMTNHAKNVMGGFFSALSEGAVEANNGASEFVSNQRLGVDNDARERFEEAQMEYLMNKGKALVPVQNPDGTTTYQDPAWTKYQKTLESIKKAKEAAYAKIDQDKSLMGTTDMLMNLPLLWGNDVLMFSKLYSGGWKAARRSANAEVKATKDAYKRAAAQVKSGENPKALKSLKKVVEKAKKTGFQGLTDTEKSMVELADKGSFMSGPGEYIATKLGGKYGGAAYTALSPVVREGNEEMAQSMAQIAAGEYYGADVKDAFNASIDPKATKEAISWWEANRRAMAQTYGDPNAWEEGFIGGLTGLLGSPSFLKSFNSNGKWVQWNGGTIQETKEYLEKYAKRDAQIAGVNAAIKRPEFAKRLSHFIAQTYYDDAKKQAVMLDDKKAYEDAETASILEDIQYFRNTNSMDLLKTAVKNAGLEIDDDSIQQILDSTVQDHSSSNNKKIQEELDKVRAERDQKEVDLHGVMADLHKQHYDQTAQKLGLSAEDAAYIDTWRSAAQEYDRQNPTFPTKTYNAEGQQVEDENWMKDPDTGNFRVKGIEDRMEEAYQRDVDASEDISKLQREIQDLNTKENTLQAQLNNAPASRATSPYIKSDGSVMTLEEAREDLQKRRKRVEQLIDAVDDAYDGIDSATGQFLTDEQLSTLVWHKVHMQDWAERANSIYSDMYGFFSTLEKKFADRGMSLDEQIKEFGRLEGTPYGGLLTAMKKAAAGNKKAQKHLQSVRAIFNKIKQTAEVYGENSNKNLGIVFAQAIANSKKVKNEDGTESDKTEGEEFLKFLQDLIDLDDIYYPTTEAKSNAKKNIADLLRIGKSYTQYNELLKEYFKNPQKIDEAQQKAVEEAQTEHNKGTLQKIKDRFDWKATIVDIAETWNDNRKEIQGAGGIEAFKKILSEKESKLLDKALEFLDQVKSTLDDFDAEDNDKGVPEKAVEEYLKAACSDADENSDIKQTIANALADTETFGNFLEGQGIVEDDVSALTEMAADIAHNIVEESGEEEKIIGRGQGAEKTSVDPFSKEDLEKHGTESSDEINNDDIVDGDVGEQQLNRDTPWEYFSLVSPTSDGHYNYPILVSSPNVDIYDKFFEQWYPTNNRETTPLIYGSAPITSGWYTFSHDYGTHYVKQYENGGKYVLSFKEGLTEFQKKQIEKLFENAPDVSSRDAIKAFENAVFDILENPIDLSESDDEDYDPEEGERFEDIAENEAIPDSAKTANKIQKTLDGQKQRATGTESGQPGYENRSPISQYSLLKGDRVGFITYIQRLEENLDKKNPTMFPNGWRDSFEKRQKYLEYTKAVYQYLTDNGAFEYVSKHLKEGDTISFKVDQDLNDSIGNGHKVVVMTVKNGDKDQVIGILPGDVEHTIWEHQTAAWKKARTSQHKPLIRMYEECLKQQEEKGSIDITTTVNDLMQGDLPRDPGGVNHTVAEIFDTETPIFGIVNKDGKIITGNDTIDAGDQILGQENNAAPGTVFVLVPSAGNKYIPALVYSTPIKDLTKNSDYIQDLITTLNDIVNDSANLSFNGPETKHIIGDLMKDIPAVISQIRWYNSEGKTVTSRNDATHLGITVALDSTKTVKGKDGTTVIVHNKKVVKIPLHRDVDGKIALNDDEVFNAIQEMAASHGPKNRPNATVPFNRKHLFDASKREKYSKSRAQYFYTNLALGGLGTHTKNDWFTFNIPDQFNQKAPIERKPSSVAILPSGFYVTSGKVLYADKNGDIHEGDANGRLLNKAETDKLGLTTDLSLVSWAKDKTNMNIPTPEASSEEWIKFGISVGKALKDVVTANAMPTYLQELGLEAANIRAVMAELARLEVPTSLVKENTTPEEQPTTDTSSKESDALKKAKARQAAVQATLEKPKESVSSKKSSSNNPASKLLMGISNGKGKTAKMSITPETAAEKRGTLQQHQEAMHLVAAMFPTLNLEARTRLVDSITMSLDIDGNPVKAYGLFKNGVIEILREGAPRGVIYHEAFHAVMSYIFTRDESRKILDEAKLQWGNLDDVELEEHLAEAFRKFMIGIQDKSLKGRIKTFFKKMLHVINNFRGKQNDLDTLFWNMYNGKYSTRPVLPYSQNIREQENEEFFRKLHEHREAKVAYSNLDQEAKDYIRARHMSILEYEHLPVDAKENLLHCMA